MTKKRKSNGANPLSDARKSSSFYQDLWHKKSGIGYTLFVQYYGQQPQGCVSDEQAQSAPKDMKQTAGTTTGMSRAAKRRRKKKGNKIDEAVVEVEADSLMDKSAISPLLLELEKYPTYSFLRNFLETMSRPLPVSFRLRNIRHYEEATNDWNAIKEELETLKEYCQPTKFDPTIYQAQSLHKAALSKACPALKELLVRTSSQGLLARQEIGSMLPVLGLHRGKHLKTNARIVDTCASPGSKTLQALEVVGPKGRVLANDVHPKRLETLQEAVQRSGMPHLDRLSFTNYDASAYPIPKQHSPHVVLCDVPCSGDGTVRKDPTVLPSWSPATARALHELQCRILARALQVVQVGGVVSYSTCSLNPIENEAVVQSVLCDQVELIEWPTMEGLTMRPGLTSWKVLDYVQEDDSVEWKDFHSFEQAKDMSHCYPTLWPTRKEDLTRCRRLWPQDQDTGGFFVALLRKKSELYDSNKTK